MADPVARYAGISILLRREDGRELFLSNAEAQAVADLLAPGAVAKRAVEAHLELHAALAK